MSGEGRSAAWRIGVDVGGTFTDVVMLNEESGRSVVFKSPTHRDDLVHSVVVGINGVLSQGSVEPEEVAYLAAGSTIALNTIIERSGSRTGLITTKGFRDVLEIRRTRLPDAPSFNAKRPQPLVRRALVAEADERLHASGRVLTPLDTDALSERVSRLVDEGVESLAISFLHSYVNSAHENLARDVVCSQWPDLFVCISSDIWPEQREYERTLVTVMNAYIGPQMGAYYQELEQRLRGAGFDCPLLVTQSNGGMISIDEAARVPVRTLLSGPAVGVTGAARATTDPEPKLFTFDMGGTSADMAIVEAHPRLGTDSRIGDYPLFMPAVSIGTIGAGGGSIATRDSQGILKVGPRSAGAYPGPAAYGRGGTEPTITDAYVVTGILGEPDLLGGAMAMSRRAAETAVGRLADELGMGLLETAEGILRVATVNMYAGFLPLIARHGVDYSEYTLMAFGGAGPTHGFMLASEIGLDTVLVPPSPGGMCAVGAAITDLQMDFVTSGRWELSDDELRAPYEILHQRARDWLTTQGIAPEVAIMHRAADMRYAGQSYELTVDLNLENVSADEFHRRYREVYGYSDSSAALEILQLRLLARVPTNPTRDRPRETARDFVPEPIETRQIAYRGETLKVPAYLRQDLPERRQMEGPAVILQYDSTIFVTPDFQFWHEPKTGNLRGKRHR